MILVRKKRIRAVRRQLVHLLQGTFLFILLTGMVSTGIFGATGTVAAADTSVEGAGYTSDQQEGLNFLNAVRARAGIPPVQWSASITRAAIAHAEFYNANQADLPGLSAHSEISDKPGYTGKSALERMLAAGWSSGTRGYSYGEVMHFGQKSSKAAIQGWLDTAYHRAIILDPGYTEIGMALVGGTAVLDAGGPGMSQQTKVGITVYPYDQQTDVPVGFYGGEIPDPLAQFAAEYSGYIISAKTDKDMTSHTAVLTDETGAEVPFYEEARGDDLYIFPKSVLKGYHRYTIALKYRIEDSADDLEKVWSFTTGKGHALTQLMPEYKEIMINEGGQFQLHVEGGYDDGTTEMLPGSEVKYAVNQKNGLNVSANGTIAGVKSGDYLLTVSSAGVSSPIKVKVYSKWKTKAYPAADPGKLTDIKGHKALPAIEWALQAGVMTEAGKGLFKPEAAVSEAEFWTMLLRAYNINIEAYRPAASKHWADAAYLIAKERNFPLSGLTNPYARDSRITRLKIAEIIAAADGLNYKGNDAVKLVLGMDYVRCETELSLAGYQGEKTITRAEAAQILYYLRPKLSELRGRPVSATPASSLPELPPKEVYIEPVTLEDRTFFAKFHEDHSLTLKGKFVQFAGQTLKVSMQTQEMPRKMLEEVTVTLDNEGNFQLDCGPYEQNGLNLYLKTPKGSFYLNIQYKTMNKYLYSASYNS